MANREILLPIPTTVDSSNPPGLTTDAEDAVMAFDASTQEYCRWTFQMPGSFDGFVSFEGQLSMDTATSGNVVLNIEFMAASDDEAIGSESFDTANALTVAAPGTAGNVKNFTVTCTNLDSLVADDYIKMKFSRDAADGSDTATGDMFLRTAKLRYSSNC